MNANTMKCENDREAHTRARTGSQRKQRVCVWVCWATKEMGKRKTNGRRREKTKVGRERGGRHAYTHGQGPHGCWYSQPQSLLQRERKRRTPTQQRIQVSGQVIRLNDTYSPSSRNIIPSSWPVFHSLYSVTEKKTYKGGKKREKYIKMLTLIRRRETNKAKREAWR